jgi:hypothetical protein
MIPSYWPDRAGFISKLCAYMGHLIGFHKFSAPIRAGLCRLREKNRILTKRRWKVGKLLFLPFKRNLRLVLALL